VSKPKATQQVLLESFMFHTVGTISCYRQSTYYLGLE